MDRWAKRRTARTNFGALLGLLAVFLGQNAVAQDVLGGTNVFSGASFGTVGAAGIGAGPFGSGVFGVGSAASLAAGKMNATTLGLSSGVGETDNVYLYSAAKQSQTLAIAGLDVALSRHRPRLNAAVTGNFEDLYYVQHAFSNQLVGSFSGDANVGLVPNRLNWVVNESYGQNLLNPLEPPAPSNLQNVNVVSTGPALFLHPGSQTNFLQLGVRYARSDYATLPYGSYEGVGLLALGHDMTRTSTVTLHVTEERLYFNNTVLNQDYTLRKAYGSYRAVGARTALEIDAGAAQVDDRSSQTATWTTRPIAQILLTRKLSPTMTLSLSGGRQVTTIGEAFASLQSAAVGAIVTAPAYGTTSSFVNTYGSAGWTFALNRTSLAATASWERSAYDLSPLLDTTIQDYSLALRRRLTPRLAVVVTGSLDRTDYYDAHFESDTGTVDVALRWRLAPKLRATLQYQYSSRGTSQLAQTLTRSGYFNLITSSRARLTDTYSANALFLLFTYTPVSE